MKTPLSIHVLFHSKYAEGQKVYQKLYQILCRNTRNPFADGLDIPVFFGTDVDGHVVMVDDSISEKTIVLLLIDSNMRIDKIWQDFVKTTIIAHPRTYNLYCVDLYKYAFEFLPEIKYSQFIGYQSESLFLHWSEFEARVYDISIRLLEKEGKNQQKVFISHSKHDSDGKNHAEDLRDYLVHNATKLSYFFDVNSIMEGYAFNKQIEEGVKESIFITMVSNTYSDREWCRKELIEAKKNKIPVIGVYLLNGKVERMFPYIGNMPGVTKQNSWIRINEKLELLDTPGILWPKLDEEKVAFNLASLTAIREEVLPIYDVANYILKTLDEYYPEQLLSRYGLSSLSEDIYENYEIIGKKRGCLVKGGEVDYDKVATIILNDMKLGAVKNITFDKIDEYVK